MGFVELDMQVEGESPLSATYDQDLELITIINHSDDSIVLAAALLHVSFENSASTVYQFQLQQKLTRDAECQFSSPSLLSNATVTLEMVNDKNVSIGYFSFSYHVNASYVQVSNVTVTNPYGESDIFLLQVEGENINEIKYSLEDYEEVIELDPTLLKSDFSSSAILSVHLNPAPGLYILRLDQVSYEMLEVSNSYNTFWTGNFTYGHMDQWASGGFIEVHVTVEETQLSECEFTLTNLVGLFWNSPQFACELTQNGKMSELSMPVMQLPSFLNSGAYVIIANGYGTADFAGSVSDALYFTSSVIEFDGMDVMPSAICKNDTVSIEIFTSSYQQFNLTFHSATLYSMYSNASRMELQALVEWPAVEWLPLSITADWPNSPDEMVFGLCFTVNSLGVSCCSTVIYLGYCPRMNVTEFVWNPTSPTVGGAVNYGYVGLVPERGCFSQDVCAFTFSNHTSVVTSTGSSIDWGTICGSVGIGASGILHLPPTLSAGTYNVTVQFLSDSNYSNAEYTTALQVIEPPPAPPTPVPDAALLLSLAVWLLVS